jgi:hypothetical protein
VLHAVVPELAAVLDAVPDDDLDDSRDAVDDALAEAADAHAYLARLGPGASTFAQRIYLEVARELLPAYYDAESADEALAEALRRIAVEGRGDPADRERFAALAAATFRASDAPLDRRIAVASFAELLRRALARVDTAALRRLLPDYSPLLAALPDADLDPDLEWLFLALEAHTILADRSGARSVLDRLVALTESTFAEVVDPWSTWMVARARVLLGDALREEGDGRGSAEQYAAANAAFIRLAEEVGTIEWDEQTLVVFREVTGRIAQTLVDTQRFDAAIGRLEASLALTDQLVALDEEHAASRARWLKWLTKLVRVTGDLPRAMDLVEETLALERAALAAAATDGDRIGATWEYAETHGILAELHRAAGLPLAAIAADERSIALLEPLRATSDGPGLQRTLAHARLRLAGSLADAGRAVDARETLHRARVALRTLADDEGGRVAASHHLLALTVGLTIARQHGDAAGALELAREVVAALPTMLDPPPWPTDAVRLAVALEAARPALVRAGDDVAVVDGALASLRRLLPEGTTLEGLREHLPLAPG